MANGTADHFREQRGGGIAELFDLLPIVPGDAPSGGKRLKAEKFVCRERAVFPVEGACCWTRLRGNRPRRLIFSKLEKKGPVAGAIAEQSAPAATGGMPKIVLPLRYGSQ